MSLASRLPAPRVAAVLLGLVLPTGCAEVAGPVARRDAPELTDSLAAAYRADATVLAVRELRKTEPEAVEIPEALVEELYQALAAVWALDHPARDSVVERYAVHAFPDVSLSELFVGAEGGVAWIDRWLAGESPTGEPTVDSLILEFGLRITEAYSFGPQPLVVIEAGRPLNTAALARLLEPLPGVRYAESVGSGGDGDDIRAVRSDGGWRLDFSVGYGDCPAGCIHRRVWRFRVGAAGNATFLGSSGDPAPPPGGSH